MRMTQALLIGFALAPLAGCGLPEGSVRTPTGAEYRDDSGRGQVLRATGGADTGLVLFGTDRGGRDRADAAGAGGVGLGVNAFLWRATLDTLTFMPLASADPFGGTIITDWHTPAGAQDERFRAQAFVLSRQLRSDGVRVQVFRQVARNGVWTDAPVSPAVSSDLEDKVLARARELRSQSAAR